MQDQRQTLSKIGRFNPPQPIVYDAPSGLSNRVDPNDAMATMERLALALEAHNATLEAQQSAAITQQPPQHFPTTYAPPPWAMMPQQSPPPWAMMPPPQPLQNHVNVNPNIIVKIDAKALSKGGDGNGENVLVWVCCFFFVTALLVVVLGGG